MKVFVSKLENPNSKTEVPFKSAYGLIVTSKTRKNGRAILIVLKNTEPYNTPTDNPRDYEHFELPTDAIPHGDKNTLTNKIVTVTPTCINWSNDRHSFRLTADGIRKSPIKSSGKKYPRTKVARSKKAA